MSAATATPHTTSAATELARAFVADHLDEATALGRDAGELVGDPSALVTHLREGLACARRPGVPRGPGPRRPGDRADRRRPPAAPPRDTRALMTRDARRPQLDRARRRRPAAPRETCSSSTGSPSGSWSGRSSRSPSGPGSSPAPPPAEADNWITVDTLAHVMARGILAETYRWAELEQLVVSPSRWERRLVGLDDRGDPARRPHRRPHARMSPAHGLALVRDLIGDAEPDVQKALSWALRSMSVVDPDATVAFLHAEAAQRGGDRRRPSRVGRPRQPGEAPVAHRGRAPAHRRRRPQAPRRPHHIPGGRDGRRVHRPRRRRPAAEPSHRRAALTTSIRRRPS